MLKPSYPFYIVEGVCLVAEVALLDAGSPLPRDAFVHHLKMHHVMAGRGLMALVTLLRFWRRVQEARDLPALGLMTVGALLAEQPTVFVTDTVAGGAIKHLAIPCWSRASEAC